MKLTPGFQFFYILFENYSRCFSSFWTDPPDHWLVLLSMFRRQFAFPMSPPDWWAKLWEPRERGGQRGKNNRHKSNTILSSSSCDQKMMTENELIFWKNWLPVNKVKLLFPIFVVKLVCLLSIERNALTIIGPCLIVKTEEYFVSEEIKFCRISTVVGFPP